jgi:hypothetical protein
MASGILGQTNITTQATQTSVYTVPAGKVATVNLGILNIGTASATIRVAIATSTSPSDAEYIEYNFILAPSDVFERGGLVLDAGKKIVVYASHASPNITAFVTGYEE